MEHAVAKLLLQYSYPAILVLLSAAGLGVPISEDLVLLLAGALASQGVTQYLPTLLTGYTGVVLGDALIYHWGQRLGPRAYEHRHVRKVLSPEREGKLRSHFARHGFWTIVVGRHTPGLRAPIFFLAGASGVSFPKFLLADMLSAAVTVPAVVTLGYLFGAHLDDIRRLLHRAHWAVGAAVLVGAGVWWFVRHLRLRRRAEARARVNAVTPTRDVRERSGSSAV
ncbi:MAG TPA: DedA family protein [Myxococcales bacterium]|nr:DedA family protein [Myxococcales bacterium]